MRRRLLYGLRRLVWYCAIAVRKEFKRRWWYKMLSIASPLYFLFGLLVNIENPFFSWSKRVRAIILLSALIVMLLLVIEALYQFHKRRVARLKSKHKSIIERLNTQHQTEIAEKDKGLTEKDAAHQSEIKRIESEHGDKIIGLVEANTKALIKQQKKHWAEVEGLQSCIREQVTELNELRSPKLIFEVETFPQCRVSLSHEAYTFDPPDAEPKEVDYYVIKGNVKIHFENHSTHQLMLRKRMEVSLFRKTGNGKEKMIPLESSSTVIVLGEDNGANTKLEELRFEPLTKTKAYIFYLGMGIPTSYGKRLNQNCFIRITMEAISQPPCFVDLDVNWGDAIKDGSSITPRTSALSQVHRWTE